MKYIGNTASDADIEMNLEERYIRMDYNGKATFYNSNDMHFKTDYKKGRIIFVIYSMFVPVFILFISQIVVFVMSFIECFFKTIWKKYNLQYTYQITMKTLLCLVNGFATEKIEGKLYSNILTISIKSNLYVEYELFGEYEKLVNKISLKRKIIEIDTPVAKIKQQKGWNFIIEFKEIPQSGFVEVKYIA